MSGKWIAIPAVSAQAHPLYGVRGWLLAVLWLNTLPVLTSAMSVIAPMMYGGWKAASVTSFVALTWAVLSLGLVAVAFLRLRWFPVVLFAYGLLQVPLAVMMGAGVIVWIARFATWSPIELVTAPLFLLQVLGPIVTMAYAARSRSVRVTYRHQVREDDPAAAPAALDLPQPSATLTDALGHARERAALRRVAMELSSGMLDTETWMQVTRDHAVASDSERTSAYVHARMAVLCPRVPAQPLRQPTLASGLGALLVSLVATAALVAGVMAILFLVPSGAVEGIGAPILVALLLSWLGGLFLGARFLQRTA
ncbi:hypothetical protein ACKZDW_00305 (plasmid) [Ralstonia syzygii subsp. celebesensis]|uniref:Transmembrane protein n=3 Tax=Ralstonia solanacearum species complex TaxID=3116862 RepID=A0AAD0SCL1_RALSL|nr:MULTISPECIES: hypothetical protein [Ralstonia solanacearum species complex]BEU75123.1 hypothetical protein MAFF211271_46780 [Ralstonia pseudosolanacearum]AQW32056.1 hypothetical protein B0B51_19390 [blood disease bacterium A2-HR MARDI]AXV79888.1 hypothetical protein CJO76_23865 [Ralstonia solanacearum]AXV84597.1 hypothetical protein CJO77_24415 [Ralstonia solanacearum]AXV93922.1 hypothetical protein CJO79_23850 [Ralstonia solanacearum]